jgi:dihydrofolate synthase/folylpolyglutamate synthase
MLWFAKNNCDIVVLEVGLGGAYDSTNIIDPPEVAVITNIGYDHTEYLGDTLAEITRTKCGIIKNGSDVVAYPNVREVTDVIEAVCEEKGCRLDYADFGRIEPLTADIDGQSFCWKRMDSVSEKSLDTAEQKKAEALKIQMPLIGEYQMRNAATALTVVEALKRRGWDISDEALVSGMANVSWPARFEVLGKDPVFILDGGHNRQCAEAVAESLEKYFPGGGITLITGMVTPPCPACFSSHTKICRF